MNRLKSRELYATSATALAIALGAGACSASADSEPSICRIDLAVDDKGVMSSSLPRQGETYSGYNLYKNDSLRLVYGDEEATFDFDSISTPVEVFIGDLTVKVTLDGNRIQTQCLS